MLVKGLVALACRDRSARSVRTSVRMRGTGRSDALEAVSYTHLDVYKRQAMDNIKPTLEVKPKRVGGATYQVPMEVNARRSTQLGIRWMVNFSRVRKEKTMAERLAAEIIDASNGVGASVKKREDVFKMAEANRAFSHYRW